MISAEVICDITIKVSVARCARVSYENFETGKRSAVEEDLAVYTKLNLPGSETYDPLSPIHASPAEHQATPDKALMTFAEGSSAYSAGINRSVGFQYPKQHGNFIGWRQFRKTLVGESCAPLPEAYR